MDLDPILLARIQFAFTVSFHIIFPSFTIGLASFLTVLEWLWLRTNDNKYYDLYKFWIKIFAIAFGMGVVSGVVMAYQLGTNWSVFSDRISNVIGPFFGFEVLTAFFLESSFLGIMLFGWGRVSKEMHFASTAIVAVGTLISAFWILSANSWMQTPQGFTIGEDLRLMPTDWLEIIFNPSFSHRYVHMVLASFLTTAFVVGGVSAYYLFNNRHIKEAKTMLSIAALMAIFVTPVQIFVGDSHGINTHKYQPAKIAAIEAIWETRKDVPLLLFAIPDEQAKANKYEISIPYIGSLLITHTLHGEIKGLNEFNGQHPPVFPVFWCFRIMVGMGMLMLLLGFVSLVQYFRGKLFTSRFLQIFWMAMTPSGFIAILAGWFVSEIGRQPYTVYGIIKTSESVTPALIAPQVAWSLMAFVIMYIFVFGSGSYYILKLIYNGFATKNLAKHLYMQHGLGPKIVTSINSKKDIVKNV